MTTSGRSCEVATVGYDAAFDELGDKFHGSEHILAQALFNSAFIVS
jgi:hypothetical protein